LPRGGSKKFISRVLVLVLPPRRLQGETGLCSARVISPPPMQGESPVKGTATGGIIVSGWRIGGRDADVEPRLSIVTLGVGDLERAVGFYPSTPGRRWQRTWASIR
jgi:hypothetical protein